MESYLEFTKSLTLIESTTGSIEIELCSEGGDVYAALAYAAKIMKCKHQVIITGYGLVASAAVLILAAGHERVLAEDTWVMVHEDEGGVEANVSFMEAHIKHMRRLENQWTDLMAFLTTTTKAKWDELHKNTTYLTPEECLQLGLIEKIV